MGVFDIFKKRDKQLDLPPPPPPELLNQNKLPEDDLELPELPPLAELPHLPNAPNEKYEIPLLEDQERSLPPLEVMPSLEEPIRTNESEETIDLTKKQDNNNKERGPIFIKVDDYRNVLESINIVRNKLNESDYIVEALNDLRNKVDAEFENWREDLEEMQRKVMYMDKVLFEGK